MFAEKACNLVKELDRNPGNLPPYNVELVREVSREIINLYEENQADALTTEENMSVGDTSFLPTIRVRHAAIERNLRCLVAYHHNRLGRVRNMRWEFGSLLPPDVKSSLGASEVSWFSKYSAILATYMRSIGDEDGEGINLAVDLNPPKSLYIEVKCLIDYGRHELSDGSIVLLKCNSRHFLPRSECEELIRQGVFQHITN